MAVCPKSQWRWVKTMLDSVYDQARRDQRYARLLRAELGYARPDRSPPC
jgi:hypothetical protein